jgi:hypothetical protein
MGGRAEIPTETWRDAVDAVAQEVERRLRARGAARTDAQRARDQPHVDALARAVDGAHGHTTPTLAAPLLAAELVSLADFPRRQVTPELLRRLEVDEGVALCEALVDGHAEAMDVLLVSACFEWLGARRPRDVVRPLTAWTLAGVLPRWPPGALAGSLGFPLVGELRAAADAHEAAPSAETAARVLGLMGIRHSRARYKSRKKVRDADAIRAPTRTSLASLAAARRTAVVADLSGTKLRSLPDVLLRCEALRHLVLEDDYFDDAEKRAIEARLHWVRIRWTRGLYVDGRHGR